LGQIEPGVFILVLWLVLVSMLALVLVL